jgi:hypothetical protein
VNSLLSRNETSVLGYCSICVSASDAGKRKLAFTGRLFVPEAHRLT